jgi:hypothetical protein
MATSGIWRPPQWAKPAMVSITVPATQSTQQQPDGTLVVGQTGATTYVFDAVLKLSHTQRLTKTHHPVQTGADLSSHAYLEPAQVTMFIGMSDAMDSYASSFDPTQPPYITPFTGNPSKSVSAYQQLLTLQAARQPLIVTTRLRTYKNMVILTVEPEEDNRTIAGLRVRVEFEQIITAVIVDTPNSARTNDTASTGLGVVNAQTPDAATVSQFSVAQAGAQSPSVDAPTSNLLGYLRAHPSGVDVPGAGAYSSVNTISLSQLPSP